MILFYPESDEDLKFVLYFINKSTEFINDKELCLQIDDQKIHELDQIIRKIFELYGEECSDKKISEFKRIRQNPSEVKGDVSVITVLNYINLVKQMLLTGQLKNKDYIDSFTSKLNLNFDPDFYLLEIKAGLITQIDHAEGMDKLFCEKVLADKEYIICSGLRGVYEKENLCNNTYLFLLNIKKTKFKSLESEGMICCAADGDKVEALKVEKSPNTRIELEGYFSMFEKLVYEKVDLKKAKYKLALEGLKIIDHHLTFKGIKVTCGGQYVKTAISNGEVR